MAKKLKVLEYRLSDEIYMHSVPCVIRCISHSKPQTEVKLIVDGDPYYTSSEANVNSFSVWGEPNQPSLVAGLIVSRWFRVEAPDAHCVVILEQLERGEPIMDKSIGTRACPACDKLHTLDLDTNYIRCSCGRMFDGAMK